MKFSTVMRKERKSSSCYLGPILHNSDNVEYDKLCSNINHIFFKSYINIDFQHFSALKIDWLLLYYSYCFYCTTVTVDYVKKLHIVVSAMVKVTG